MNHYPINCHAPDPCVGCGRKFCLTCDPRECDVCGDVACQWEDCAVCDDSRCQGRSFDLSEGGIRCHESGMAYCPDHHDWPAVPRSALANLRAYGSLAPDPWAAVRADLGNRLDSELPF